MTDEGTSFRVIFTPAGLGGECSTYDYGDRDEARAHYDRLAVLLAKGEHRGVVMFSQGGIVTRFTNGRREYGTGDKR